MERVRFFREKIGRRRRRRRRTLEAIHTPSARLHLHTRPPGVAGSSVAPTGPRRRTLRRQPARRCTAALESQPAPQPRHATVPQLLPRPRRHPVWPFPSARLLPSSAQSQAHAWMLVHYAKLAVPPPWHPQRHRRRRRFACLRRRNGVDRRSRP